MGQKGWGETRDSKSGVCSHVGGLPTSIPQRASGVGEGSGAHGGRQTESTCKEPSPGVASSSALPKGHLHGVGDGG